MSAITKTIVGLAGIITASAAICKFAALYGDKIRPQLGEEERAAFDVLVAACIAFGATKPISSD